ncbi:MAG: VWA domain-containing protein [bacterium]|nr:VWA domain-containing protein [bacterium]
MKFADPNWLYLLIIIPLLALFSAWAGRRRQKAIERFGNPLILQKLSTSSSGLKKPARKLILFLSGVLFLILALARPQWGARMLTIQRQGIDIMIGLDTSKSMLAEDIKPCRLERAKHEIASLIDKLRGDRIGLLCFAGDSLIQCPLTLDHAAAKTLLKIIDTQTAPLGGTAIGQAIQTARKAFVQGEQKYKVLILLTDGEDHNSQPIEAAREAAKDGIKIYTIGIGSKTGEPIPIRDQNGAHLGYQKDQSGRIIMSKLDEATLEKIATITGGKYYPASGAEMALDKVYQEIANMEKKTLQSKKYLQYEDRFGYFLFPALCLFLMEFFFGDQRKKKAQRGGRFE